MSRTIRNEPYVRGVPIGYTWSTPGYGKWMKRQLHKAERRAFKGTGKTRSVARWTSEVNYKGT